MTSITRILLIAAALAVTGCSSESRRENGSLSRSLDMIDKDGKRYGHVELDPVGGGKVYDADGRMIGKVTPASN